jgi:hypothetical protein
MQNIPMIRLARRQYIFNAQYFERKKKLTVVIQKPVEYQERGFGIRRIYGLPPHLDDSLHLDTELYGRQFGAALLTVFCSATIHSLPG